MKNNKHLKAMKHISSFLIILGVALIVAVSAYEVVNYPWYPKESADELPTPEFPESDDPEIVFTPYEPNNSKAVLEIPETSPLSVPVFSEQKVPGTYMVLGSLKIPKINVAVNLLEGVESTQLGSGVGHIIGTPLPGQSGNCVLAGHRLLVSMHPFRHLDKLTNNDKIHISFNDKDYVYEVYDSFVVAPDQTWVTDKVKGEEFALTLITCETIYNPVDRLIVRARLIE